MNKLDWLLENVYDNKRFNIELIEHQINAILSEDKVKEIRLPRQMGKDMIIHIDAYYNAMKFRNKRIGIYEFKTQRRINLREEFISLFHLDEKLKEVKGTPWEFYTKSNSSIEFCPNIVKNRYDIIYINNASSIDKGILDMIKMASDNIVLLYNN